MHPELERARARYQAQETPEELSLAVVETAPETADAGVLLFVED